MKTKKVSTHLCMYLCAVAVTLVTGCGSDELSRSKAKKMVEKHLNGPMYVNIPSGFVEFSSFDMPSFEEFMGESIKRPSHSLYKELEKKGLIQIHDINVEKKKSFFNFTDQMVITFPEEIQKKYINSTVLGNEDIAAWTHFQNYSFEPNNWNKILGEKGEKIYTGEVYIGEIPPGKYRFFPNASGKFTWEWNNGEKSKDYDVSGVWHNDKVQKSLPFPKQKWGSAFLRLGECYLQHQEECIVESPQKVYGELNIPRIEQNYETDRTGQAITVPLQVEKLFTKDTSKVLLGDYKVREITGITHPSSQNGRQVCFVDFIVDSEVTPFGLSMLPEPWQKKSIFFRAKMFLYDDGWRIVTNRVAPLELSSD